MRNRLRSGLGQAVSQGSQEVAEGRAGSESGHQAEQGAGGGEPEQEGTGTGLEMDRWTEQGGH